MDIIDEHKVVSINKTQLKILSIVQWNIKKFKKLYIVTKESQLAQDSYAFFPLKKKHTFSPFKYPSFETVYVSFSAQRKA